MKIHIEYANKSFHILTFWSCKYLRPESEFEEQHFATTEEQLTASNTVIPSGMKQNIHQCKSEYSKT